MPARVNVDELEREVLEFWEKDKTFEKSITLRKGAKLFTFYDGPPYATGKPHYGHVLQSSIKDAVLRYKTMRGYYVPRRVGWDTHGLPVEVFVEKELGFKNKKDVEEYGIEKFNQKCRETVFRYIDVWVDTLKRLGRWADYEGGYATLDRDYMESEWWVFKQLWNQGLVYKDFRSTPYCIRCGTPLSNYEAGEGYKDKTDLTVYVRLRVDEQLSLLVWTTTPWTLPGNVAVAINPKVEYVTVEHNGEHYVAAEKRAEFLFGKDYRVTHRWQIEELLQLRYQPLFGAKLEGDAFKIVLGDYVTTDEGTGLVHQAPAFGAEDAEIAKKENLPVVRNVDGAGVYTPDVVPEWLAGMHIWKANPLITEDLKKRGLLFKEEQYTHSYPHCWRCDQPLIYYALDTWFVKVTDIKDRMAAANEEINWIPAHIKHGRFGKGIESAPDWSVSRNRFWSVPMPIWECSECEERVCVGSGEELKELSGVGDEALKDLHRPYVDEISWECSRCREAARQSGGRATIGKMIRVPEVLDVWFDSGSMPFSQWHYPFENKEFVEEGFPADFIAESIEMTRAWFYFLHVLSVAVKNRPAYKNVIGSGIIFGSDGNKLSKKLKNYPEIEPTIEKYGADTVRMFFLASTFGEPYVFSEKELQELFRNFTMRLWNVYSFFVQYANTAGWSPKETSRLSSNVLDKWVLARLKQLEHEVISANDEYRMDNAARLFVPFVDDLSNWYVRRSRDRFQPKGEIDEVAFRTLYEVLIRLSKLLAPFMPFTTEAMYRNLTGGESVHLQDLSDAAQLTSDEEQLLRDMVRARAYVSQVLALRAKANIKVRQPLEKQTFQGDQLPGEITGIVQYEVNVRNTTFAKSLPTEEEGYVVSSPDAGEAGVALAIDLTPELKLEGMAREIVRQGQVLRRKAGYKLNDKICLVLVSESAEVEQMLSSHHGEVMRALQAKELALKADSKEDVGEDITVEGARVHLGVKKIPS